MKFVSICFKHKEGGYNKKLYEMYRALSTRNNEIFIISAEKLPVKGKNIRQNVLKVPCSEKENLIFWFAFCLKSFFSIFKITLKHHPIDGIINFSPFYSFISIIPVILTRTPSIVFVRADNMKHSQNKLRNIFFYLVDGIGLFLAKRVVFNSKTLRERYYERYFFKKSKCVVLTNHIDGKIYTSKNERTQTRQTLGIKDNEFLISTSGLFNSGKNFEFLIKALASLKDLPVRLLIIGDEIVPNGEKARLKSLVVSLDIEKQVIFCGWKDDPRELISISDIFVFPSKHEGMSNSLLEALSCDLPCFGSNIDEIAEVLEFNDLLFSIADDGEYVTTIRRLVNDNEYYGRAKKLSNLRHSKFIFNWDSKVHQIVVNNL